jgi:glycosyltransferase involved in cell wall biosynthesis
MADAVVAQHSGQVIACKRSFGHDAVEIPNCYTPPSDAVATVRGVVLWAGTVKSIKRPELFLELARRLPTLQFRMIGGAEPSRQQALFDNVRMLAAGIPNLQFRGFVPFSEIEREFNQARLLVNTSSHEGFPNTFLQAWARGIPTVSFIDCRAQYEGQPVATVCNDFESMVTAVDDLCRDDVRWRREGERARRNYQNKHAVKTTVSLLMDVVQSLSV